MVLAQKPLTIIKKTRMYYTNCHRKNHYIETCRIKRKENHVLVVFEVTIQQIKVQRPVKYSCHICGDTRHKIIDCPKYNDMQNMFKNKMKQRNHVVEPKVTNISIHMVNVNMAITRSKVIKEDVFKDKKLIKKSVGD
jgi:hypothetical protein